MFTKGYKLGNSSLESRDKLLFLIHTEKMLHIPEFMSTNVKQPIIKLDIYGQKDLHVLYNFKVK